MFAARYFAPRYFAPKYFPPALDQGGASGSGVRRIMPPWFSFYIGENEVKKLRKEYIEAQKDLVREPELLEEVVDAISVATNGRSDGRIGNEKVILQSRTRRKVAAAIAPKVYDLTERDDRKYLQALIEAVQRWHEIERFRREWRRKRDNEAIALLLMEA